VEIKRLRHGRLGSGLASAHRLKAARGRAFGSAPSQPVRDAKRMARVFTRKDRHGRSVYYIDYAAILPDTGQHIRKKERVGYSRRQAESALESRLTDVRRGQFDGIFPPPTCSLVQIRGQYLKYSKLAKSPRTVARDEGILDRLRFRPLPIGVWIGSRPRTSRASE